MQYPNIQIGNHVLKMTCGACPEQYDVFHGDEQVGYLRLRHGTFSASVPDYGGETVYEAYPQGDGIFEDDERVFYLRAAVRAIDDYWLKQALEQQLDRRLGTGGISEDA